MSQHNQVTDVDVIPEKVNSINKRKSPIQDSYISKYLAEKELNLTATLDGAKAYSDADFVIIAASSYGNKPIIPKTIGHISTPAGVFLLYDYFCSFLCERQ